MHVLIGALFGAVFAVGATAVVAVVAGKRPTAEQLLLAALGGAVAGGFAAATLGAGGAAAAGIGRQVVGFAGGGAAGGTTEQAGRNVLEGRPVHENLDRAAALGAINGSAALGVTRGTVAVGRQVFSRVRLPRLAASVAPNLGNVFTRAYERSARPLTGRSLGEVERQHGIAPPIDSEVDGGAGHGNAASGGGDQAAPAPARPVREPAPEPTRRPRSRGFANALAEATSG